MSRPAKPAELRRIGPDVRRAAGSFIWPVDSRNGRGDTGEAVPDDKRPNHAQRTRLSFFESEGNGARRRQPPLVPRNDPTLMFVNAGMVQFKNLFSPGANIATTPARAPARNACAPAASTTTSTMSATPRAITPSSRCWEFQLRRLFQGRGDPLSGLGIAHPRARDCAGAAPGDGLSRPMTRPRAFWKKHVSGLPDDRIIRIATDDNFWSMGETGPCGPCTEIFYDHGPGIRGAAGQPGRGWRPLHRDLEPRLHAERAATKDGRANALPPSIDTGMGLERDRALLQGSHNNYDTTCSAR